MASHTIKVTGVSTELLELLDKQIAARHATGRSEYIRELIRKDVLFPEGGGKFRELLALVHDAMPAEETEEDTAEFVDELIATNRRERRGRQSGEAAPPPPADDEPSQ